jgi:pyruvate/2-oxoglutarate/acetoin dehydrogenase E1 component
MTGGGRRTHRGFGPRVLATPLADDETGGQGKAAGAAGKGQVADRPVTDVIAAAFDEAERRDLRHERGAFL